MNDYKLYSDVELTALLKIGDETAYTELYNRYWSVLYIHALKMLKDDAQAMDIVQDIYTILWNKRADFIVNTSIKSYLYTAVRNHTLNYINRSKLKEKYLESLVTFIEKGELNTEMQVHFKDFAERIDREINNFSPRMKKIFELSRNDGLSNKDIARELDITDHTVKKTINRALRVLKTQISTFLFF